MQPINNITEYLKRFKNIKPSDSLIKENFIKTVEEILKIKIKKSEINIQKDKIFLTTHPIIKNEIYLKKI